MMPDIYLPEIRCLGTILQEDPLFILGEIADGYFQLKMDPQEINVLIKFDDVTKTFEEARGNIEIGFEFKEIIDIDMPVKAYLFRISKDLQTLIHDRDLFLEFWPEIKSELDIRDKPYRIASTKLTAVDESYIVFLEELIVARNRQPKGRPIAAKLRERKEALEMIVGSPVLVASVHVGEFQHHSLYINPDGTLHYHD